MLRKIRKKMYNYLMDSGTQGYGISRAEKELLIFYLTEEWSNEDRAAVMQALKEEGILT